MQRTSVSYLVLPCFCLLSASKKILWSWWWFGKSSEFPIWFSLCFLAQSRITKVTFNARLMLPEGALTVHVWLNDTCYTAYFTLWELKGFNNVYCLVRVLLSLSLAFLSIHKPMQNWWIAQYCWGVYPLFQQRKSYFSKHSSRNLADHNSTLGPLGYFPFLLDKTRHWRICN